LDARRRPLERRNVGCGMAWSSVILKWVRRAYLAPLIVVAACAETPPPAAAPPASPPVASTVPPATPSSIEGAAAATPAATSTAPGPAPDANKRRRTVEAGRASVTPRAYLEWLAERRPFRMRGSDPRLRSRVAFFEARRARTSISPGSSSYAFRR